MYKAAQSKILVLSVNSKNDEILLLFLDLRIRVIHKGS